jgi:hypothetical protein
LTTQIRARFPDQEVLLPLLKRKQRKKVEARFSGDTRNNVALDLVHGMDLADLLMVAAQDAGLRSKFGIDEASRWRELEDPLVGLRNSVAHPDLPFLQPGRMVADLVELEATVRGMLSRLVR